MCDQAWHATVREIGADPDLYESILRSVTTSMALAGLEVDEAQSRQSFEDVLNGPPLRYPGQDT